MKLFNSLQMVGIFALFPFAIEWVSGAAFQGHTAVLWLLIALYVAFFVFLTAVVYEGVCEWDKK